MEAPVYCQGEVHGTMRQICIIYYTLFFTTLQKLCFPVMNQPKHSTTSTTCKTL